MPGDDGVVRLSVAPAAGATYRFRLAVDAETQQRNVRTVVSGTLVAGERDDDGSFHLEQRVERATVDVASADVRLPPGRSDIEGALLSGKVDAHGDVVSGFSVSDAPEALTSYVSSFVWGAPRLPAEDVPVGGDWRAPADWAFAPANMAVRGSADLTYDVTGVERGFAEVEVSGQSTGTSHVVSGLDIVGELRASGDLSVSLDDGLRAHGVYRGDIEWSAPSASGPVNLEALPSRLGLEWCVWKDGEEPESVGCGAEARYVLVQPVQPTRVARVFEGAACDERADALRDAMAAAREHTVTHLVFDGSLALPTVDGAHSDDQEGLIVVVRDEGYRVEGRDLAHLDDVVAIVDARMQQWRETRDATAGPLPVYVMAAADAGAERASGVAGVLRTPASDGGARSVDVRLAVARDAPAPPEIAEGTPDDLRAEIVRARDALSGLERAQWLATGIERAIGACPAILTRFAASATATIDAKMDILSHIDEDVRACRCGGVDVDALEALLGLSLYRAHVFGWIEMPVAPDGERGARPLRLARSASVQDLATALSRLRGDRPVHVAWTGD